MPISRAEFDKGKPDATLLVLDFLASNEQEALTVEELMNALASTYTLRKLMTEIVSKGTEFTEEGLRDILRRLQEQGKIESKTIGGAVYYIHNKAIGFSKSA